MPFQRRSEGGSFGLLLTEGVGGKPDRLKFTFQPHHTGRKAQTSSIVPDDRSCGNGNYFSLLSIVSFMLLESWKCQIFLRSHYFHMHARLFKGEFVPVSSTELGLSIKILQYIHSCKHILSFKNILTTHRNPEPPSTIKTMSST